MAIHPQPISSPLAKLSPIVEAEPVRVVISRKTRGEKYTLELPDGLLDRARSALVWTQTSEGVRPLKDLLAAGIEAEVRRLEDTYNHGEPFPTVGRLPSGPRSSQ